MRDILTNPKLKSIMVLYVMMMGFDLFGRFMLPQADQTLQTAKSAAETQASDSGSQTVDEEPAAIDENGDAIPINREGFDEEGTTTSGGSLSMNARKEQKEKTYVRQRARVHVSRLPVQLCLRPAEDPTRRLWHHRRSISVTQVSMDEYPVGSTKKLLGTLISYSHWAILLLLVFGDKIMPSMGIIPPPIYYRLKEKQWMVIIGSYFLTSQISSFFLNSGAFEVYCNEELIYSKLATKKMPDPIYILSLVRSNNSVTIEVASST